MKTIAIIIILTIIILSLFCKKSELFTTKVPRHRPYIHLYENFNQNNLVFTFDPLLSDPTSLYLKYVFRGVVKSVDINVPLLDDDENNNVREVKIWKVYDSDNLGSLEGDFYNTYTDRNVAYIANDSKYKLLYHVNAGERITLNVEEPIKKLLIYARF